MSRSGRSAVRQPTRQRSAIARVDSDDDDMLRLASRAHAPCIAHYRPTQPLTAIDRIFVIEQAQPMPAIADALSGVACTVSQHTKQCRRRNVVYAGRQFLF